MKLFTAALCSYNRAERLPPLIAALRAQKCDMPFEILMVDNNSTDNTQQVLASLAAQNGVPLRYVKESQQGIPFARNRALQECMESEFMLFMDDDEMPKPGLLQAAIHCMRNNDAECAGGKIKVCFGDGQRPDWLGDDLLGFLAEVDYGNHSFWVTDSSTPLWTANVAYKMSIFKNYPGLRFNIRYNRIGKQVGGGEDLIIFQDMLALNIKMRYCPEMEVDHYVETWRLKRRYFLKLHFVSGKKTGLYESENYTRTLFGIPFFMITQSIRHLARGLWMTSKQEPGALRQLMNWTHSLGMIYGRFLAWKNAS